MESLFHSYILFLYIPRITETLPKGPSRVQGAGVVWGWMEGLEGLEGIFNSDKARLSPDR